MFIDASAVVALLAGEPGSDELKRALKTSERRHASALVVYEAVLALIRILGKSRSEVLKIVQDFLDINAVKIVAIDLEISELALEAFERFGKGGHPASLNMGDCFSYACAKKLKQPLLFKGDDFSKTDILKA